MKLLKGKAGLILKVAGGLAALSLLAYGGTRIPSRLERGSAAIYQTASALEEYCDEQKPSMGAPIPFWKITFDFSHYGFEMVPAETEPDPSLIELSDEVNKLSTELGIPRKWIPESIEYIISRGIENGAEIDHSMIEVVNSPSECGPAESKSTNQDGYHTWMSGCEYQIGEEKIDSGLLAERILPLFMKTPTIFTYFFGYVDPEEITTPMIIARSPQHAGRICELGKLVAGVNSDENALKSWYALANSHRIDVDFTREKYGQAYVTFYLSDGTNSETYSFYLHNNENNLSQKLREILGLPARDGK
jgi:hypothetical protein